MSGDIVIRAENLGKKYIIGHQAERERYTALRDVIARGARNWARSLRDLVSGAASVAGDETEEFWALKDVSFEISRGEVVGVIGRNGAGKSTLLKVLSRITEPSEGRVEIKGRVASLLEVGTGFHPELSGRENIYLNGAILGMSRAEIKRKFDEIVAFAEIEKFLDTPVKRYSSGMYVRLAFAVAAHLEPEILIVDEVLAVGDAEFQKKCLGKMQDVAGHGRTVLFVSHNMAAVSTLCPRTLVLHGGKIARDATTSDCLGFYHRLAHSNENHRGSAIPFKGTLSNIAIDTVAVNGNSGALYHVVDSSRPIDIAVDVNCAEEILDLRIAIALAHQGQRLLTKHDGPARMSRGKYTVSFRIPQLLLRPGEYWLSCGASRLSGSDWLWASEFACIAVGEDWSPQFDRMDIGSINLVGAVERAPRS
jgi:lipopolysaccharide transport system ATP-binding protein